MKRAVLALLAACGESSAAGIAADAGVDVAAEAAPPGPTKLVVGARLGDPSDDLTIPNGPGLIVSSTDMMPAFAWAHDRTTGDVVVLSAIDASALARSIADAASFHSVQNVIVPKDAAPADCAAAAAIVDKAEMVWIAGGDQSTYVTPWRGTPLPTAISHVWARGGVVGGTSAGALVLGQYVYDATVTGTSENVTPEIALADPFDPKISFTRGMLAFPPLAGAITEVHFEARDRMGRIVSFMARQHADGAVERTPKQVLGLAVSDGAAVAIDSEGMGALLRADPADAKARAYAIVGGVPETVVAGQRLSYPGLAVYRFDQAGQRFDFAKWCGNLPRYPVDVRASDTSPFGSGSVYDRPGTVSPCP